MRYAFAVLVTLLAGFQAAAQPITIGWAAGAQGNQSPDRPAKNLTLAPDGKCSFVSRSAWVVAATFNQRFTYSNLAEKLTGVTADDLKSYDFIAFEGNSSKAVFENSIWFVTDNAASASGLFLGDVTLPEQQLRFKTGVMSVEDYKKVFKKVKEIRDAKGRPIEWVGWILVDIPDTMKMDRDHLKLFLTGVHKGATASKLDGSPDPDAIGLIVH